jgi:membrane associated rhomboid family serine protease
LVLHAMNVDHQLEHGVFGWRVLVDEDMAAFAQEQWQLYQIENQSRPVRTNAVEPRSGAGFGALVWGLTLVLFFMMQSDHAFNIDWTGAGRLDVAAVRAGDWWRTLTALTLHIDVAHLLVNIGFGAVFGTLLAREIGPGYAWACILLGGAAGNFMNALVQRPIHLSIGASTAVFAALGLLGAYLWIARRMLMHSWASRLSPVVSAVILLAWLGTGDERTDIVAHLTGFIAGFALGAVLGRLPRRPGRDPQRQWIAGGAALILVFLSWSLALGTTDHRVPVF